MDEDRESLECFDVNVAKRIVEGIDVGHPQPAMPKVSTSIGGFCAFRWPIINEPIIGNNPLEIHARIMIDRSLDVVVSWLSFRADEALGENYGHATAISWRGGGSNSDAPRVDEALSFLILNVDVATF